MHDSLVGPGLDDLRRDIPQLDHAPVVRQDLARFAEHQDSVDGDLLLGRQQQILEGEILLHAAALGELTTQLLVDQLELPRPLFERTAGLRQLLPSIDTPRSTASSSSPELGNGPRTRKSPRRTSPANRVSA